MDWFEMEKLFNEKDVQIMRNVIFGTYKSKYALAKAVKIPIATLLRKVKKLEAVGMIVRLPEEAVKKDGSPDKRKGQRWDVTIKGLVYLLVNDHLKDKDIENGLMRLFYSAKLQAIQRIMKAEGSRAAIVSSFIDAMFELRMKINFQHFNKEYVVNLFSSFFEQALWKRFDKALDPIELKRLVRNSGKKSAILKWYTAKLKDARLQRKDAENKIDAYRKLLSFVRSVR
ncbi:hypothetical protein KAU88_07660 [Candidatus Bathyarchaeota archaeon]|nr:hypothetical protein [Candidatus Bathyarchaeota archaeon]